MKEINIEFRYTLKEAMAGGIAVTNSSIRGINFDVIACIAGVFLFINLIKFLPILEGSPSWGGLFYCLIFTLIPFMTRRSIRHKVLQDPNIDKIVHWHITNSELSSSTAGSEGRFAWVKIIKIAEKKKRFLLYIHPQVAHWIPKHAFPADSDIELLREFAKNNSIKYNT